MLFLMFIILIFVFNKVYEYFFTVVICQHVYISWLSGVTLKLIVYLFDVQILSMRFIVLFGKRSVTVLSTYIDDLTTRSCENHF